MTEVTIGTAARILDVPIDEIDRMCLEGKLRARRIGERGRWMINYSSLIDFRNEQLKEAARKKK